MLPFDIYTFPLTVVLTSKLEGINEEPVGETHLEIIEKSDGESNLWSAVVKPGNILCQENTKYCSNDIVHP